MASYHTSIESKNGFAAASRRFMLDEIPEPGANEMEGSFQRGLPLPSDLEPGFGAALRHLLRHPGSMVRPRLVSQVAAAFGVQGGPATDLAVAHEYFHTASLVFDDLPCMDNATSRRGAPCVHVPFGEPAAILAALGLINRAYALCWKALAACPRADQASKNRKRL